MILSPDFKEFVELLNAHSVRFLVAGGYAVAVHGHPRYTKDLDVWIEAEPRNVNRLLEALNDFGFGSLDLTCADFLTPDQVIQLGYPPNRIDMLTSLGDLSFEDCYDKRMTVDADGAMLPIIGLEGLRASKRKAGRYQDLADLENLKQPGDS